MYLIEQNAKGERFAATPNDVRSYSQALHDAERHFARNPDTVTLYLWNDGGTKVVRTYVRSTRPPWRVAEVLFGFHEWPEPYPLFPGSMPEPYSLLPHELELKAGDKLVQLTERAYEHELNEADRLGYNRGFKVGISHRNRERAAQLRRQADSLDRIAGYVDKHHGEVSIRPMPGSVREGVYGGGRQEGKTWAQSHPDWS